MGVEKAEEFGSLQPLMSALLTKMPVRDQPLTVVVYLASDSTRALHRPGHPGLVNTEPLPAKMHTRADPRSSLHKNNYEIYSRARNPSALTKHDLNIQVLFCDAQAFAFSETLGFASLTVTTTCVKRKLLLHCSSKKCR